MNDFIKLLKNNGIYYEENIDLKKYSTYKTGGKARVLIKPSSKDELIKALTYIKKNYLKYFIVGNGSNLIFPDEDFNGVIINLKNLNKVTYMFNGFVKVEAGASLVKLALETVKKGFSGLEFAAGIPASLGGAIYMNAGAYKSDMSKVVSKVTVLTPDFKIIEMVKSELQFSYRSSFFLNHKDYIILDALLLFKKGDIKEMMDLVEDRRRRRLEAQQLSYPSAGSVFRNLEDTPAWKVIDSLGLKGKTIGGAKISEKHGNFIINYNNASSNDIIKLIKLVEDEAYNKKGIKLTNEQIIVKW